MAFWLFLTAMDLLIPAIMVGIGTRFLKHPPKTINALYGYRTARSMKNQETWDFAHQHCARLWVRLGVLLTVGASVAMYLLRDKDYASFLPWVLAVEAALFCVSAFLVDALVKQKFEEEKED